MTTVGIITYHKSTNYGANLQAYALQRILTSMEYVPEIINYSNAQLSLSSLSSFRRMRHAAWRMVARCLVGTERQERTESFRRKHLPISSRQYSDFETLHMEPPQYDAYITGSDQVWNPFIQGNDSSYFLTFGPIGKKRISYAASFGISKVPDRFASDYQEWLGGIHHLSTRELEGRHIIKQLTGRNATVTLDPTLLLDQEQWEQIAVPCNHGKPYILCYYMPGDEVVNRSISKIAYDISAITGWNVVSIGRREYMRLVPWRNCIFSAGPAEFVGLFQNASFVVTNSFHGTAFAISFRKPFIVPVNQSLPPEKALSSRITSLLSILALEDRLVCAGQSLPGGYILDVDYQTAEITLQQERQTSIEFLRNALEGA